MEISVEKWKEIAKTVYREGNRESHLLLGPAGVGKSESVKQFAKEIAEELGLKFEEYDESKIQEYLDNAGKYFLLVDMRLTEVEPADLIGIPRDVNGHVEYKPLGWAVCLNKNPGVLFLDEITNVQRLDVQSTMYKLLLDRRVGYIPLHKDAIVIAAGNRPEDASIANALPAPAINRVLEWKIKVPSIDEWIEYMHKNYNDWDFRVAAFLKKFSQYFIQKADEETLEQFATPRKWTRLALSSKSLPDEFLDTFAEAEVGQEAAIHFCSFCRLDVPDPEEILRDTDKYLILAEEEKYFAIAMIASKLSKEVLSINPSLDVTEEQVKKFRQFKKFFDTLFKHDKEMLVLLTFMFPKEERFALSSLLPDEVGDYLYEVFKQTKHAMRGF